MGERKIQIAMRLTEAEIARLDHLVSLMADLPALGGIRLSRAIVARLAVINGINYIEHRLKASSGGFPIADG